MIGGSDIPYEIWLANEEAGKGPSWAFREWAFGDPAERLLNIAAGIVSIGLLVAHPGTASTIRRLGESFRKTLIEAAGDDEGGAP